MNRKPINVYKYRCGGDEEIFNRDLTDLEGNRFYAPSYDCLNDPCETLVYTDTFDQQASLFSRILGRPINTVKEALETMVERKNKVGIYSLSKTYENELLWAHYANSHFGFCVEYNLELLLDKYKSDSDMYPFDVQYSKRPPQINLKNSTGKNALALITKMVGTKSIAWSYEEEYRIILDQNGHRTYNHKALRAIYFGLRMEEKRKHEIMTRLQGRGIKYFQMDLEPKSYKFVAKPVEDIYGNRINYLTEIPVEITRSNSVKFKILESDYHWSLEKGTIIVELESSVNETSLQWLANLIQKDLFSQSKRIYMTYYFKEINHSAFWASSHFENGNIKVEFHDYSWID